MFKFAAVTLFRTKCADWEVGVATVGSPAGFTTLLRFKASALGSVCVCVMLWPVTVCKLSLNWFQPDVYGLNAVLQAAWSRLLFLRWFRCYTRLQFEDCWGWRLICCYWTKTGWCEGGGAAGWSSRTISCVVLPLWCLCSAEGLIRSFLSWAHQRSLVSQ